MKPANSILAGYGTSVFEVMSRLAIQHRTINLGQGFPDGNGPADVRAKAAEFLEDRPNQYPPMLGVPELRQAVAQHAKRFYGLGVDWEREVMVASGATEVLANCLFGLIEPGDEVVLFEPLYDSYLPIVRRAGGVPRLVRLAPPRWELSREELAAAFSEKTKLILLNSPMNPAAKLFSRAELAIIAELLERYDAYAVCDEVYEHLVFDGQKHIPLMTLPGMRERCLRIGSAGKTFALTGWKVGYVTAPPALLQPVAKSHQFVTFTTPPNLQRAVAYGLGKGDDYFRGLAGELERKRDFFAAGLREIGFDVLACQGTYFITADFRPLGFEGGDIEFCRHITTEAGVTAIPVSAFYQEDGPRHFVRFAFCKEDAVLTEALARLRRHLRRNGAGKGLRR
ncbi:MAG TPA: aminotransferase [Alphaproteobacteria bacterium]|nr:aminotransferase [Alphaproteobacteria bacterium]